MKDNIKTIIWDLDNTLYKFDPSQIDNWNETTTRYALKNGVDLPYDTAIALAEKGWVEQRNSGYFFQNDYGLCSRTMHVEVNKALPVSMIQNICDQTPSLMQDMTQYRHVILTLAIKDWAHRVLDHTGLAEFFDPDYILGAEDYNFEDKAHSPRGIQMALDKVGGNANEVMFVEDTLPNLVTAKKHTGIVTSYLHHNRPINDDNADMDYVDVCVRDTPELLKWFKQKPSQ